MSFTRKIKDYIVAFAKMCQHKPVSARINIVELTEVLQGRVALITGGTSGIGFAIAKAFHHAGATVVITSRTKDRAEEAAAKISSDRIYGVEFDVTRIHDYAAKVEEIKQLVNNKPIDILVNNAGLVGGDIRNATTEEQFDKIMDTNLKSAFYLSKIVATDMIRNKVHGNILNLASSSSTRPATSAYVLSKWGIRGLTLGLAKMLIPHGIVVNGIAPGPTATPMLGKNDYSDISLPTSPIGRYCLSEEIASMAVVLCGPQGRSIVGDIIYMTGGAGVIEFNDIDYNFSIDD